MTNHLAYPYLAQFLGGYFHQDCYDDGALDLEIIDDFIASSWPYQRLGVRADIGKFLHEHGNDALRSLTALFAPDVLIGETDAEVRAWLAAVAFRLERVAARDAEQGR